MTLLPSPLVSVVVPCYNHEDFLETTIDNILSSSYVPLEVVIVDDGSTDRSFTKALALKKKYPNVRVYTQENSGPSQARNHAVEQSKGKYILPVDADDLISPDYIKKAVEVLESFKEVKVVYARAEKFGAVCKEWKLKDFSRYNLARENMIYVSALFRKEDWERVGGYTVNPVVCREDWEFWIKILKSGGEVVKLPFVGFYYRILPNSRRHSMTKQTKRNEIAYLNLHHADFFGKYLKGPLRVHRTYSKFYNQFINFLTKLYRW